jgi:hypothetical protein
MPALNAHALGHGTVINEDVRNHDIMDDFGASSMRNLFSIEPKKVSLPPSLSPCFVWLSFVY